MQSHIPWTRWVYITGGPFSGTYKVDVPTVPWLVPTANFLSFEWLPILCYFEKLIPLLFPFKKGKDIACSLKPPFKYGTGDLKILSKDLVSIVQLISRMCSYVKVYEGIVRCPTYWVLQTKSERHHKKVHLTKHYIMWTGRKYMVTHFIPLVHHGGNHKQYLYHPRINSYDDVWHDLEVNISAKRLCRYDHCKLSSDKSRRCLF